MTSVSLKIITFVLLMGWFLGSAYLVAAENEFENLDKPLQESAYSNIRLIPKNNLLGGKDNYAEMMKSLQVKIFPHTDDRAPHRKDTVPYYLKFKSNEKIYLKKNEEIICQSKIISFNEENGVTNIIKCVDENRNLPIKSNPNKGVFDYHLVTDGNHPIQVIRGKRTNNYFYRGELSLNVMPQKLLLVNTINMENYIKGVVPGEIYVSWPFETVRAQAVAARSYALYQLTGVPEIEYYHFDDTTSYQVYIGDITYYKKYQLEELTTLSEEDIVKIQEMLIHLPEFFRAIETTRGEVMLENEKIFQAYFHAASGGFTVSATDLNFSDCSPCKGVVDYEENDILTDPFAMENLFNQEFWEVKRSKAEVEKRLKDSALISSSQKLDKLLLPIDGYGEPYWTPNGHYVQVPLLVSGNIKILQGYPFKSSMGLKNVRYEINQCDGDYIFKGRGYGHSVGLSQWGAYFKGKMGLGYLDILNHYYQNIILRKF